MAFGELFGFGGQFNLHPTAMACSGEGAVVATGNGKRIVGGLVSCHLGRVRRISGAGAVKLFSQETVVGRIE